MNRVQTGNNQYCGPAALSIISGYTVDYCAQVIGDIIGKEPSKVKGVHPADLFKAFDKLRIKHDEIQPMGISLFAVASNLHHKIGTYLVTLPKHFVVIEVTNDKQIFICDNHVKEPLNLANSARLSQKVENIWKCYPKPPAKLLQWDLKIVNSFGDNHDIQLHHWFEDSEDNYHTTLGHIRANKDQLALIAKELNRYLENNDKD
jgi:hypothetical protein